jgi:UDP-glucose 4-epimerase
MNIVVVGGAGYIGSHMVKRLIKLGHHVMVIDNLSKGYRQAVKTDEFYLIDIADSVQLSTFFATHSVDAVFHFASFIEVAESIKFPEKYYQNNYHATRVLLEVMVKHGVKHFVFSSTAAIFGQPLYTPIDEKHPQRPINPYGESKRLVEEMLGEFDREHGLKSVALRYFNAAGADPDGELGECHQPETHLIPLVLQVASKRRPSITIFGDDYDTPDGTCIRDYIHVNDLADAHLKAIDYLVREHTSLAFNLGNGKGFSVKQIIDVAQQVTGEAIRVEHGARRDGDPDILVADASLAKEVLGWVPRYQALEEIIAHAWAWEKRYPWAW